jgi:hypothetical protein
MVRLRQEVDVIAPARQVLVRRRGDTRGPQLQVGLTPLDRAPTALLARAHRERAGGPPAAAAGPALLGFRDLTEDEAKQIDAEYLARAQAQKNVPNAA